MLLDGRYGRGSDVTGDRVRSHEGGWMMARELLSQTELDELAGELTGWDVSAASLARTYRFGNFVEAFGFMASAALVAEKMDHHPNWSNVYNSVEVSLNTHDRGGVTELDAALARAMDSLAGRTG